MINLKKKEAIELLEKYNEVIVTEMKVTIKSLLSSNKNNNDLLHETFNKTKNSIIKNNNLNFQDVSNIINILNDLDYHLNKVSETDKQLLVEILKVN